MSYILVIALLVAMFFAWKQHYDKAKKKKHKKHGR